MNTTSPPLCQALLLILLFFSYWSFAQPNIEWDKTYGGNNYEECQALLVTPNGYLLGGMTTSEAGNEVSTGTQGFPDFWVLHTDMNGTMEWDARFGCNGKEIMWDMAATPDGGYLLAGYSDSDACPDNKTQNSRGEEDFWLIKIDHQGNKEWDKTYGGTGEDRARRILPLSDGNYLIGGWSSSAIGHEKTETNRGLADFWILKVDAQGNKIWDKTFGGTLRDQLFDMIELTNGEILLGGWSESDAGNEKSQNSRGLNDFWLVRIQANGDFIQDYTYGGDAEDAIQYMLQTKDGNVLLLGQSGSAQNTGEHSQPNYGDWDYWLLQLDINNDYEILNERTFGGAQREQPLSLYENLTGKIWILGVSHSAVSGNKTEPLLGGENDYWILQLDRNLDEIIWQKSWGGDGVELPTHIDLAHGGGYVIAGISSSDISLHKSENSRGLNDIWLLKTGCALETANFSIDHFACADTPVELDFTPLVCDNCFGEWDDGHPTEMRTETLSETSDFVVYIIHQDACERAGLIQVEIGQNPQFSDITAADPDCFGDENGQISITSVSQGLPPYEYAINDEPFSSQALFDLLAADEYIVTVRDAHGCLSDSTFKLEEPLPLNVSLGSNQVIDLGQSIDLEAFITTGVDTFIWSNPEELSCTACLSPSVTPTETTTYEITVFNENDCFERDVQTITVRKDQLFYAPNIFSPNDDGMNDFFRLYSGPAILQINSLQVFNRWGGRVFEAIDIAPEDQFHGWDGQYNGRKAQQAVYIWWAEIEYIDGRTEVVKGDVTLIR